MKQQRRVFQPRTGRQNIFRTVSAGRKSEVYALGKDLIFKLSSYPSYIVEVFLRKNFGERYYTFSIAIIISIAMLFPMLLEGNLRNFLGIPWLVFTLAFLYKSIRHRMEFRRFGTSYNFDRYSYSDGEIHPFFWNFFGKEILGVKVTRYLIHVLIEPGLPIIIGLFLTAIPFTRGTGILILISGVLFCYRNIMKAYAARDYILDIIDEQIVMHGKHDVLMEEKPKNETKGLSFPIELPSNKLLREEMLKSADQNSGDIWHDEFEDEREAV